VPQNLFSLFYQLIECWSSFAIGWIRLVELVTRQRLYPWIRDAYNGISNRMDSNASVFESKRTSFIEYLD